MTRNVLIKRLGPLLLLPVLGFALTGCNEPAKEITGVVYNAADNTPMEGVYVFATYEKGQSGVGLHSSSYCFDAVGVFTRKDGRYVLPVIGNTLPLRRAIAVDYLYWRPGTSKGTNWFAGSNVQNDDIFMKHRSDYDSQPPSILCRGAMSKTATAALKEYFEISRESQRKYATPAHVDATSAVIESLESRPVSDLPSQP